MTKKEEKILLKVIAYILCELHEKLNCDVSFEKENIDAIRDRLSKGRKTK
jgi:hypothetical protein